MKDRIQQIMQKEGLTNAEFAEKIGVSTSSLSHIFSGRNNPSLDVVMRIHKACPYVNLDWLLYGEGQMETRKQAVTGIDLFSQAANLRTDRRAITIFARKTRHNRRFTCLKKL